MKMNFSKHGGIKTENTYSKTRYKKFSSAPYLIHVETVSQMIKKKMEIKEKTQK